MNINQNNTFGNNTVNVGAQQRHLESNLKQQLNSILNKSEPISLNASMGDGEAAMFAEEIKAHLLNEGYEVDGVNHCIWMPPQKDNQLTQILLMVKDK
jgi:hypothetical protein